MFSALIPSHSSMRQFRWTVELRDLESISPLSRVARTVPGSVQTSVFVFGCSLNSVEAVGPSKSSDVNILLALIFRYMKRLNDTNCLRVCLISTAGSLLQCAKKVHKMCPSKMWRWKLFRRESFRRACPVHAPSSVYYCICVLCEDEIAVAE